MTCKSKNKIVLIVEAFLDMTGFFRASILQKNKLNAGNAVPLQESMVYNAALDVYMSIKCSAGKIVLTALLYVMLSITEIYEAILMNRTRETISLNGDPQIAVKISENYAETD